MTDQDYGPPQVAPIEVEAPPVCDLETENLWTQPKNLGRKTHRKPKKKPYDMNSRISICEGQVCKGRVTSVNYNKRYGWIERFTEVNHSFSENHNGPLFFHIQDIQGDLPEAQEDGPPTKRELPHLKAGSLVQFQLYYDDFGLGAKEVYLQSVLRVITEPTLALQCFTPSGARLRRIESVLGVSSVTHGSKDDVADPFVMMSFWGRLSQVARGVVVTASLLAQAHKPDFFEQLDRMGDVDFQEILSNPSEALRIQLIWPAARLQAVLDLQDGELAVGVSEDDFMSSKLECKKIQLTCQNPTHLRHKLERLLVAQL